MKSSLAAALLLLQLANAGLVVVLLCKRNAPAALDPAVSEEIRGLAAKVQGAVNQMRVTIEYLDGIRRREAGGAVEPSSTNPPEAPPVKEDGAGSRASSTFPAASEALAKTKKLEKAVRDEIKKSGQNVSPLKAELELAKGELISRGNESVVVVGDEVGLQVFEKGRDPLFIAWLLDQVVPAFSARARDDAFRIARGALVRSNNEAPVKAAAARALQKIDDKAWVKEVCDVINLGSNDEIDLRAQLLGLFADSPRPEAVDVCIHFMENAQYPAQLRTKAVMVIEKQDSGAVNPALRKVLFEDTAALMKTHALDALWERLKDDPGARRKLLEDVLAIEPARLPDGIRDKAQSLLAELSKQPPPSRPPPSKPK